MSVYFNEKKSKIFFENKDFTSIILSFSSFSLFLKFSKRNANIKPIPIPIIPDSTTILVLLGLDRCIGNPDMLSVVWALLLQSAGS